jgi:hypothetical protein
MSDADIINSMPPGFHVATSTWSTELAIVQFIRFPWKLTKFIFQGNADIPSTISYIRWNLTVGIKTILQSLWHLPSKVGRAVEFNYPDARRATKVFLVARELAMLPIHVLIELMPGLPTES